MRAGHWVLGPEIGVLRTQTAGLGTEGHPVF